MCQNPPYMNFPSSTRNPGIVYQMSKPLNPDAQSFRPEQKALPTTVSLCCTQPPLSLPPPLPAWSVLPGYHDGPNLSYPLAAPYGSYGPVFYDICSQPQPVYGFSISVGLCGENSGVEKVEENIRGDLDVYETSVCGKKVGRELKGRILGPRFSRRKPTVNCRERVWMPKNGGSAMSERKGASEGKSGGGVLPFPPVVLKDVRSGSANCQTMNIHQHFNRGKSCDQKSGGHDRIIPFPATVDELIRSEKTTVMIKNIPNQFRRNDLLAILDKHCRDENMKSESFLCKSAYDFVYLPMDFMKFWSQRKTSNLGYAFVNFATPVAAFRFFNSFHEHLWAVSENKKTCEVTLAELQGKEALINSFRKRIFWCECYSFLPVVFNPPRDGSNDATFLTVGIRVPCVPPARLRKSSRNHAATNDASFTST